MAEDKASSSDIQLESTKQEDGEKVEKMEVDQPAPSNEPAGSSTEVTATTTSTTTSETAITTTTAAVAATADAVTDSVSSAANVSTSETVTSSTAETTETVTTETAQDVTTTETTAVSSSTTETSTVTTEQEAPSVPATSSSLPCASENVAPTNNLEELQKKLLNTQDANYGSYEHTLDGIEVQCAHCFKWFPESKLECDLGKCVPFMTNYVFYCRFCSVSRAEIFSKKQASFSQMCQTAIANLMVQHRNDNPPKILFSKDKEIIPFLEKNWEILTTMPRRVRQTWHITMVRTMTKDSDIFVCKERPVDVNDESDYPLFGLVDQNLVNIVPHYEPNVKLSNIYKGVENGQKLPSSVSSNGTLPPSFSKSRGAKRKALDSSASGTVSKKTRGDISSSQRLPSHGYPLEHPFNKDGYRYILTETDPHAPAAAFDLDQWAGKPIPAHLYRTALSSEVLLALHDRAPQLKISEDRLAVTGDKGYCMVRATHGVSRGAWYWEATIEEMPAESATRIGWAQSLGNLQAPLGYDKFGYSWRSMKGTKFHQSRGCHFSDDYGLGDTLGFLIVLPDTLDPVKLLPATCKDKALIKFKSHLYFEVKDFVQETEKGLQQTDKSKVMFFKNGVCQGVAYENVFEGTYYPSISLYKNATVSVNFGPEFKYPPKEVSVDYQPIQNTAAQAMVEHTLADILYHVEHEQDYIDAATAAASYF
ncbi:set1/Ash2 histone methyltransferase complex subunit ASH2-like [Ptychodera flava]|uniref:set1/Ash2 histone methyltransferase complex subunit ASH2-like n=1 Tax=Ptychodera flava TaxID=63121 RepID=UPI00396A4B0E